MRFSEDELTRVQNAIEEAEAGTTAEIIPVIAESSARYDRAEDCVGILFAAAAIATVYVTLPVFSTANATGSWAGVSPMSKAAILVATLFVSFILGSWIATRFPTLSLLFVSKRQMRREVKRRAQNFFHTSGLRRTKDATGVLLYVSLFEQRAEVLADDNAMKALSQDQLSTICETLVQGFKEDQGVDGMVEAIKRLGNDLAETLPSTGDDENELPNGLVLLNRM